MNCLNLRLVAGFPSVSDTFSSPWIDPILNAVSKLGGKPDIIFWYPGGNCIWPAFASLGICSNCRDITLSVRKRASYQKFWQRQCPLRYSISQIKLFYRAEPDPSRDMCMSRDSELFSYIMVVLRIVSLILARIETKEYGLPRHWRFCSTDWILRWRRQRPWMLRVGRRNWFKTQTLDYSSSARETTYRYDGKCLKKRIHFCSIRTQGPLLSVLCWLR